MLFGVLHFAHANMRRGREKCVFVRLHQSEMCAPLGVEVLETFRFLNLSNARYAWMC